MVDIIEGFITPLKSKNLIEIAIQQINWYNEKIKRLNEKKVKLYLHYIGRKVLDDSTISYYLEQLKGDIKSQLSTVSLLRNLTYDYIKDIKNAESEFVNVFKRPDLSKLIEDYKEAFSNQIDSLIINLGNELKELNRSNPNVSRFINLFNQERGTYKVMRASYGQIQQKINIILNNILNELKAERKEKILSISLTKTLQIIGSLCHLSIALVLFSTQVYGEFGDILNAQFRPRPIIMMFTLIFSIFSYLSLVDKKSFRRKINYVGYISKALDQIASINKKFVVS